MIERASVLSLLKRTPIVKFPVFETRWSTDPNRTVKESENAMMLERMSILRNFKIPEWEKLTTQVAVYIENKENRQRARRGRKCIDGRYEADDSQGMIGRPGGDYGYAAVLAALTDPSSPARKIDKQIGQDLPVLTPEKCFDMVFDIITTERGNQFYMHTDFHEDESHIGCGYATATTEDGIYYRFFGKNRAKRLLARAREQLKIDQDKSLGRMHMEKLEGSHEEQAVIYVVGKKKTVRSQNKNKKEMYFIYDITRDYEYMVEKLLPALTEKLKLTGEKRILFFRQFLYLASLHTDNSLSILANYTPRVMVDLDGFRPEVTMLEPITKIDLRGKFNKENTNGLVSGLPLLPPQ